MTSIFPAVQPEAEETKTDALPVCKEVAWDFDRGVPAYSAGMPVIVTRAAAVRVWIWKALKTARCAYDIYTWDYGCEIENLVGQAYSAQIKEQEAVRYIREALMTNPYITDVRQIDVSFGESELQIACKVMTIYGEVDVNV